MIVALAVLTVVGFARPQNSFSAQEKTTAQPARLPPLDDALLRWPILPGNERYAAIDGKAMHKYVVEQAVISRRYRDRGHPKFWGRITGTSGDAESAAWLADKFKTLGLSDVRLQPLDLEPQWMPKPGTCRSRGAAEP
jgi:hypothetical protein